MRILITNNTLAGRAGSELYVRDVALGLLKRGHTPIAYSTLLGDVAQEIRAATVPVVDNLDLLGEAPDLIHGQHHLETMTALLRFPGVPAVNFCHGWLPWEENPARHPRILRYVAVDRPSRDRLIFEHGIPEDRVCLVLNFVDLDRFKPREQALPARPQRALIFSNNASEHTQIPSVREACARRGITLDVIGSSAGNPRARPEDILERYEIVFARARSALEALAVGAAVILCDKEGVGPLVTTADFERLRPLNFGLRALTEPFDADIIERQIARYDAEDAARVSKLVRACAGRDQAVDKIISLYQEVIAESKKTDRPASDREARSAAAYLRWLARTMKATRAQETRAILAESARDRARTESDRLQTRLAAQERSLQALQDRVSQAESERAKQQQALFRKEQALQDRVSQAESERAKQEQALFRKEQALQDIVSQAESERNKQEQELFRKEQSVRDLSLQLAAKEAQLERITQSLGWRLVSRYGPIKYRFLLPAYQNVRRLLRADIPYQTNQCNATPETDTHENLFRVIATQEAVDLQTSNMKTVFTDIHDRNAWGSIESVSGPGSTLAVTSPFRDDIPLILEEIGAKTLLDAGCGDFNWMNCVRFDLDQYIGVDVVSEIVSANQSKYGCSTKVFVEADITRDNLPQADVILCRDCFVHYSFADVFAALQNFKRTRSQYLLTTTFTSVEANTDMDTSGWRPLNLRLPPFNFPEPIELLDEKTSESVSQFRKYLGLWRLRDLPT